MPQRFTNLEEYKHHIYAIMHTRFRFNSSYWILEYPRTTIDRIDVVFDAALCYTRPYNQYIVQEREGYVYIGLNKSPWSIPQYCSWKDPSRFPISIYHKMKLVMNPIIAGMPIIGRESGIREVEIILFIDPSACALPILVMQPNVKYTLMGFTLSLWNSII
jgi:hypothetical protein